MQILIAGMDIVREANVGEIADITHIAESILVTQAAETTGTTIRSKGFTSKGENVSTTLRSFDKNNNAESQFQKKEGLYNDLAELRPDIVIFIHSCNSKRDYFKILSTEGSVESKKLANSIRNNLKDGPLKDGGIETGKILGDKNFPYTSVVIYLGNAADIAFNYKNSKEMEGILKFNPTSVDETGYLKELAIKLGSLIANGVLSYCEDAGIEPVETPGGATDQPSYSFITDPVEIVDYDIPTADRPSVQASISAAAETALMNIHDKQITLTCDYLIYFDDVLMNDFVLSYSCNLGVDIGIGRASVALIYAPQFNKININDSVNDGIENGTQLRIFMRNVFTETYVMCFEGIIKQKVLARDASGFTLSFVAVDYVYWMNKIIAPISIPINEAISPGERLKWKAQSVDPDLTAKVEIAQAGSLKGKTLTEYFDTLKEKSFTNSKVYSESNSVANWDDVVNRVEIMGDINELLVRDQVIDFVVNSNSVFADTVYVSLSNTTQGLLMEMYQDRDGIVRIKPPFWNEPVLKNHIIDPMMIISAQESTDWNKYYTRIIVTGGVEEWMDSGTTAEKVDLLTPVGVYLGSLTDKSAAKWADYTSEGSYPSSYNTTGTGGSDTSTSGSVSNISNQSVIDYLNTMRTPQEWGVGTGTQCVELPKHYVEKCFGVSTKANGYGHGKDLYSGIASAFPDLFEAIPWSSGVQPRSGDIMSTSSPSQPAYGHALIVKSVSGSSIGLLDQWSGIEEVRDKVWTLSGDTITLGSEVRTIYGLARPKNI